MQANNLKVNAKSQIWFLQKRVGNCWCLNKKCKSGVDNAPDWGEKIKAFETGRAEDLWTEGILEW